MSKFTFFWGKQDAFSQWHPAAFSHDGKQFSCAEQAMMYRKAKLFGDIIVCQEILKTTDPKEHKALGRKVHGFDEAIWVQHREQFVYEINRDKFTQNPHLFNTMMKTVGTELVEASPYDKIWGIGMAKHDAGADDKSKWKGLNLLGKTLTRLRDDLAVEYKVAKTIG